MSLDETIRELVRSELAEILPKMLPNPADEYLTTKQVAELTGLSIQFFEMSRSRDATDQPPYSRVGRRIVYRRSDVEKWLASRTRGGRS
ncbi:MAG: helix-turn-helix domain-containing protein [Pseudomonadota bacterium]